MTKNLKWLSLGGFLAAAVLLMVTLSTQALALGEGDQDLFQACMNTVTADCRSWAAAGGGSEAPRGLTKDSKAELAMGEQYILTGEIALSADIPYLGISFATHPWLASRARLRNPYYRLRDTSGRWKAYEGRKVAIVVTARYAAWTQTNGHVGLEVLLEPSPDPIIDAIQPVPSQY